jgi:hypothetical protein
LEQFHETGVVVHHQHTHALYLALPVAPGAEEDLQDVQRRRVDRPGGDPIIYRVVFPPWTLPEVDARTYVDELCDRSVE